jgi:mRNA-degrading endonuclease RelE of RelBE toxin-antitoxin system
LLVAASLWTRSAKWTDPFEKIRFRPNVQAEVCAIEQRAALNILEAIHRYADTGAGRVKPLSGEFEGLLRLRVGTHRVFFDETEDTVTIHRIRDRREAYR